MICMKSPHLGENSESQKIVLEIKSFTARQFFLTANLSKLK
jgi:hypothetical protein